MSVFSLLYFYQCPFILKFLFNAVYLQPDKLCQLCSFHQGYVLQVCKMNKTGFRKKIFFKCHCTHNIWMFLARDQTHTSKVTQAAAVGFLTHCATAGTPEMYFFNRLCIIILWHIRTLYNKKYCCTLFCW